MKHAQLGYFGDVVSDLQSSTDPDIIAGLNALQIFWQAAQSLNPQMPTDFPSFLEGLEQALVPASAEVAWPGYVGMYYPTNQDQVFRLKVSGIGQMINVGGTAPGFLSTLFSSSSTTPMTSDQVTAAMQSLAQQGNGAIPTDFNSFQAVLTNSATSVNFMSTLWYVAGATAAQVVQGTAAAGQALVNTAAGAVDTLNIFAEYEPYFLAGAAVIAAYVAYTVYVKPFTPRHVTNPRRCRKKR